MSKAKLATPALKAKLKDAKTITLTWDPIKDVDSYEVDDVPDLTKIYDAASNPTTATFTKTDATEFDDNTIYNFFVTAKPTSGSTDKDNSEKGKTEFTVDLATLTPAPTSLSSVPGSSAPAASAGVKKGVKMNLDLTADMKDDGTFETVKINESKVNNETLKSDPSKEDMKTILDKIPSTAGISGGARKSRKSRKTKRTKKGGKKRRSTRRSR